MKKEEFQQLVQAAREADLLLYFQKSGYTTELKGGNYYVKEFPGLCIKQDTNQWYNHYTNEGRTNNSIDCLTKVLGCDFKQAVYGLTGNDVTTERAASFPKQFAPQYTSPPKPTTQPVKKELHMPQQSDNMRRLFAYFCQTRKIPFPIVEELVHAGLLYQDAEKGNAVFVHKDKEGKTIGAEIQGTNSFKRYKGIAAGTGESAFQYMPIPAKDGKPKRAYVFESAIDLMSFYAFCDKKKMEGAVLVSMAGLKPTVPNKLREQGVQIISCVDNDDSGRKFEADNQFPRSESVKSYLDYRGFKDWNELLVFRSENANANLLEQQPKKKIAEHLFTRRK